ncbi:preprotein translocase subunit TatA [Halobacteriales archaeon QS_5_68_33]|nr:MAG: preprotein translocase subunit TatA [Halobacteriales archaeon QS_5_68_33]
MVPLQMGVPGGPELLVILLVMLLLFGLPILLLGVGGFLYLRSNADDETKERIAELEAEMDELKRDLDTEGDDPVATGAPEGPGDDPQTGD